MMFLLTLQAATAGLQLPLLFFDGDDSMTAGGCIFLLCDAGRAVSEYLYRFPFLASFGAIVTHVFN
jgi:hypothetical protein